MIRKIAKDFLTPSLKPLDFNNRGAVWNRKRGEFVDVISLQRSKGSSEFEESITVNIGLVVPEFIQAIYGKSPPSFFQEGFGVIRVRLGEAGDVSGRAPDKWWDVTEQNLVDTANEIQSLVLNKGLPFLESFRDFETIVCHLEQLHGWQTKYPYVQICRALAYWKLRDEARSEKLLSGPASIWEEQVANVRMWMQRHPQ